MTKLDLFWMSNKEWIEVDGFGYKLREDAPQEAKESYERYLEQIEKASESGAL